MLTQEPDIYLKILTSPESELLDPSRYGRPTAKIVPSPLNDTLDPK